MLADNTQKLQAILFQNGLKLKKTMITNYCGFSEDELMSAFKELDQSLEGGAMVLLDDGDYVALTYNTDMAEFVASVDEKEYSTPLSQTAQEILSIILYAGPISKTDVDFLRGVNSQHTIRRLTIRGLIMEVESTGKSKKYKVAVEYLSHLGIKEHTQAINYEQYNKSIKESLSCMVDINNEEKDTNGKVTSEL